MKIVVSVFFIFATSIAKAQPVRLHIMAGFSNYSGDIQQKGFTLDQSNAVFTGGATYNLTEKFALRGEYSFTELGADDKKNSKPLLQARNLNFKTIIQELSLMGEYDIFNLYDKRITPYVFAGIGLFQFSPYTFDSLGKKAWLAGLSTEGQGFPEYPDRKVYKTKQLNIPFGGGIKYALSDDIHLGFELGIRTLFTDYLDDVSTRYVDENILFAKKGSQAVNVAFRGDELKINPQAYPSAGTIRGSSKSKDYYYFGQFRISFRMNWFNNNSEPGRYRSKRSGIGCPSWKQF